MKQDVVNNKKASLQKAGKPNLYRRIVGDSEIRWFDILIPLILMAFCFVSYEMRDLLHTAGCSYGYLDGHFFDFYDYLAASGIGEDGTVGLHASYMASPYLVFAIWNIPMKLFGIVPHATAVLGFIPIMWAKILPCLVFFGSGYVVYLIAKELQMDHQKARICTYAYLTAPIALFSQFILGQYESFTVFCMVMGFYYWLKKKNVWFIFWFALSITFKVTAFLFFLPLLVLREKNVMKIILSCIAVFLLYALEYIAYMGSPVFMGYAFGVGTAGDNPMGYIMNAAIFTGFDIGSGLRYEVYLTFLSFGLLCGYSYFKRVEEPYREADYAVFIMCLSAAALFCFSKWHPQWLMFAIPFWTLSAFLHRDTKALMALEMVMSVLFIMFTVCQFRGICDEVMLKNGIFKFIMPGGVVSNVTSMGEYLDKIDMSMELSLITALMAIFAVFKHPKYFSGDGSLTKEQSMGWIRARLILPMLVFILPSLLCVKDTVKPPVTAYLEERRGIFVDLMDASEITQTFTSQGSTISKLKFPVSRGGSEVSEELIVRILDGSQVLYETHLETGDYAEGVLVTLKPGITVEPGKTYTVGFSMPEASEDTKFHLLAFDDGSYANSEKAGEDLGYHLNMNIYQ